MEGAFFMVGKGREGNLDLLLKRASVHTKGMLPMFPPYCQGNDCNPFQTTWPYHGLQRASIYILSTTSVNL